MYQLYALNLQIQSLVSTREQFARVTERILASAFAPPRYFASLVGSPVRGPAYTNPPVPTDRGNRVIASNRGSPLWEVKTV